MTLTFGTDGVRGDAEGELTDEFVHALGRVVPGVLGVSHLVVGRDPRWSGSRIETALAAGLSAGGARVDLLGVVPTPGVAHLASDGVAGAMISASHNVWSDNGIKLFLPGGRKLTDEIEAALEEALSAESGGSESGGSESGGSESEASAGPAPGQAETAPDQAGPAPDQAETASGQDPEHLVLERPELVADYRRHLLDTCEMGLDGLRVVLDCAHGAASTLAPDVFTALGATVEVIHADPDGRNINEECGSTNPDALRQAMGGGTWDVGLAFDGDADRALAVDENGTLIDGDQIMAMCAIDRRDRGLLPEDTVVVTVMSNLGFRRGMADRGIRVMETPVGDRYVLEVLEQRGYALGGEQSGHIVFRDLATTGDGILTGLQVCDLLMRTGRFLSDLAASAMTRYPQVLRNVAVTRQIPDVAERLFGDIVAEEALLGGDGRVLVRPSGTEPLVRVMVEAPSYLAAEGAADRLVAAVTRLAG